MRTWTRIFLTGVASLSLAGLLTSCASTCVTDVRKAAGLAQVAPQRVLVLAVLGTATSRQAVEDEVVRKLGQEGVSAIPAYSLSLDTDSVQPQRLTATLADCGADAALVCRWHLVRQSTQARSPGRVAQTAYGEAKLLGTATPGPLWSATITTELTGGFLNSAPAYARILVGAMQRDGALHRSLGPALAADAARPTTVGSAARAGSGT
jgi:hypothetical protein